MHEEFDVKQGGICPLLYLIYMDDHLVQCIPLNSSGI